MMMGGQPGIEVGRDGVSLQKKKKDKAQGGAGGGCG